MIAHIFLYNKQAVIEIWVTPNWKTHRNDPHSTKSTLYLSLQVKHGVVPAVWIFQELNGSWEIFKSQLPLKSELGEA